MQPLPFFGRMAERVGRLPEVVLLEPRLRQRASELKVLVARETGLLQCANEEGGRFRAVALLERVGGLCEVVWQRHAREYTRYTGGRVGGLQEFAGLRSGGRHTISHPRDSQSPIHARLPIPTLPG